MIIQALKWLFYLIAMVFYTIYSLLRFFSKPGTRFLFPIILAIGLYFIRAPLQELYGTYGEYGLNSFLVDASLLAVLFIVGWIYVYASRGVGLVLGIFPPISRPLAPVAPVKVIPQATETAAVVVRLAVPPLPRRSS